LPPGRYAGIVLACCVILLFASLLAALCLRRLSYGSATGGDASGRNVMPARFRVDINIARPSTLCLLPGIGISAADRIVSYRERHGRFDDLNELAGVSRVGQVTLERIRPVAYCGGDPVKPQPQRPH